jgi:hypothetical protein
MLSYKVSILERNKARLQLVEESTRSRRDQKLKNGPTDKRNL